MIRLMLAVVTLVLIAPTAQADLAPQLTLSYREFSELSAVAQQSYIAGLRDAELAFEKSANTPVAENNSHFFLEHLLSISVAGDGETLCMVGGVIRPKTSDGKCPSRGNDCGPAGEDNFACGDLFATACIPREPVDNISQRCRIAAEKDKTALNEATYNKIRQSVNERYNQCCANDLNVNGCLSYRRQMTALNSQFNNNKTADTPSATPVTTLPTVTIIGKRIPPAAAPTSTPDPQAVTTIGKRPPPSADDSCIPATDASDCVPGSLSVGHLKGVAAHGYNGQMGLISCMPSVTGCLGRNNTRGFRPTDLDQFLEKNANAPAVVAGLKEANVTYKELHQAILDNKNNGDLITLSSNAKENVGSDLQKLATLYNQKMGYCSKIDKLRAWDKENQSQCKPNPTVYQKLTSDANIAKCAGVGLNTDTLTLYQSLAEIAACPSYHLSGIEDVRSSQSIPGCVVNLNTDGSTGKGSFILHFPSGKSRQISWDAEPDSTKQKFNQNYWHSQFDTQMKSIAQCPLSTSSPSGKDAASTSGVDN